MYGYTLLKSVTCRISLTVKHRHSSWKKTNLLLIKIINNLLLEIFNILFTFYIDN